MSTAKPGLIEFSTRILRLLLFGVLTGAIASLAAIAFVEIIVWLNDLLLVSPRSRIIASNNPWLLPLTILAPAVGGLLVGWWVQHIPDKRPHSPADVIQAAHSADGNMPVKTGLLTTAASLISLGSGASVGQYGPLVYMGATIGSWIGRLSGVNWGRGGLGIGCGVAAAIATVFNAPIAGIVFAHEVVLRHYSLRAFAPVTVASTIGYLCANEVFNRPPLFRVEEANVAYPAEFLGFIFVGISGALVAVLFMRAILYCGALAAKTPLPAMFKPALAGLILGLVAIWLPDVLGIGKETLRFAIIDDAFTGHELAITLLAKLMLTALCLGFGFAGGVFSPALVIGALFGAVVGTGVEFIAGDAHSDIAIYGLCGMAALASPVIGAPLTSILIVFELTRNYDLTTAVMVSVVFSNVMAYRVFGRSLFDVQLARRGFDLSQGREKVLLETTAIHKYIDNDFTRVSVDATLKEVRQQLLADENNEAYVVDENNRYIGSIMLNKLHRLAEDIDADVTPASEYAEREHLVFTADMSVWSAMEAMRAFVGESIPVVRNANDDTLAGVVYESAIVKAYLDTEAHVRHEQQAAD